MCRCRQRQSETRPRSFLLTRNTADCRWCSVGNKAITIHSRRGRRGSGTKLAELDFTRTAYGRFACHVKSFKQTTLVSYNCANGLSNYIKCARARTKEDGSAWQSFAWHSHSGTVLFTLFIACVGVRSRQSRFDTT